MGFFKVMGCAALGVGAVAAAPFTGGGSILAATTAAASLAGAGTIAAAAGAGVAGAAIGSAMSDSDREEGEREGLRKGRAEAALKIQKLESRLEQMCKQYEGTPEHYKYIIALSAVGSAAANADGHVSSVEMEELKEFVGGAGFASLPKQVKGIIEGFLSNPPGLKGAIKRVKELESPDWQLFEEVIEVVGYSDDDFCADEQAFLEAFKRASRVA